MRSLLSQISKPAVRDHRSLDPRRLRRCHDQKRHLSVYWQQMLARRGTSHVYWYGYATAVSPMAPCDESAERDACHPQRDRRHPRHVRPGRAGVHRLRHRPLPAPGML
jgi:hypothetical protein